MSNKAPSLLTRLDRYGRIAEDSLLTLLLGLMISLGALQILQRNFFSTSFPWSDELLRLLVLWLGLVGAVAASRDDRHITIDILSRFLSEKNNLRLRLLLDLFTTIVCGVLAWHGVGFIRMEQEFGATALDGLPAWIFELIIPLAFGLIAWRYAVFFLQRLRTLNGMRGES